MITVNSSALPASAVLDHFPSKCITFRILIGREDDGKRQRDFFHHVINALVW